MIFLAGGLVSGKAQPQESILLFDCCFLWVLNHHTCYKLHSLILIQLIAYNFFLPSIVEELIVGVDFYNSPFLFFLHVIS